MIYLGQFKDIDNEKIYTVSITTNNSSAEQQEIKLSADSPLIITYNSEDDVMEPIKTYSATINIVTHDYMFDLYNVNFENTVKIIDNAGNILFWGYITPNIYSTDYNNYSIISVEAISPIAMLKYKDYTPINSNGERAIHTMGDIIGHCLSELMFGTQQNIYFPDIYGYATTDGGTITKPTNILSSIYLDERNFYDDDEEETPWKMYDVLVEICRFMNVSLCEYNNEIYFINYRAIVDDGEYACKKVVVFKTGVLIYTGQGSGLNKYYNITKEKFRDSGATLSLSETFHKMIVKANTYPYDSIFTDLMDTQYWKLWPNYNEDMLRQFGLIPQLIHTTSNASNGYYNFFWFYFYTENNTMFPARWTPNAGITAGDNYSFVSINTPALTLQAEGPDPTTGGWLAGYFTKDDENAKFQVGSSLMQTANYEVTDPTLVSSLSWTKTIVLYTGIGNYTYTLSQSHKYDITRLIQRAAAEYLNWCAAIKDQNYKDEKNAYLLELRSDSDVIISKDSYLCINGKMGYYTSDFEDPTIKEYTGKDKWEKKAFKKGRAYNVIDQYDVKKNRTYFGFPMVDVQIECGNKILVQFVTETTTADGDIINDIDYRWDVKNADHGDGTTIIPIPVGTNEFAYFKMFEITNTCDWRLGINNGKGFAIPMKASDQLSGQLVVRFINADPWLVYHGDGDPYINNIYNLRKALDFEDDYRPEDINQWIKMSDPTYWSSILQLKYNKVYRGYLPNYIIMNDLSFKIYDVAYNSTFELTQKADNKESDHIYQNIINENALEDYDDIEVKINTQVPDKNRSFSSILYLEDQNDEKYNFITEMQMGEYTQKIQENNIIDNYIFHYGSQKCLFEPKIKMDNNIAPYTVFNASFKNGYAMFLNGGEWDVRYNSIDAKIVEF